VTPLMAAGLSTRTLKVSGSAPVVKPLYASQHPSTVVSVMVSIISS